VAFSCITGFHITEDITDKRGAVAVEDGEDEDGNDAALDTFRFSRDTSKSGKIDVIHRDTSKSEKNVKL